MIESNDAMIESQAIESNTPGMVRERKRSPRNAITLLAATLGMLALTATARAQATPQPTPHAASKAAHVKEAKKEIKRRVINVTINKGETYTIGGLEKGAKTKSKVVANPNSVSVQPQPSGDIVLLGTEGGSWKIDATLASGEKVTYDVKVKAEAPPINSLEPGSAPTAIGP
jgi:hypothetical protein